MPSRKSHSDPIKYHAYGKVKGFYRPGDEDITLGKLTTEDGTIFSATLYGEALARIRKDPSKLAEIGIWRCFFRTRPSSLCLTRVKFDNFEYTGKNKVDNFVVAGEVLGIGQGSVRVRIKKNRGSGKPFNLSLKGNFDYDPSHKFYRFELRRQGKSYYIVRWKKVGLSAQTPVDKPATAVDKKGSKKEIPKDKQKLVIVSYIRKKV